MQPFNTDDVACAKCEHNYESRCNHLNAVVGVTLTQVNDNAWDECRHAEANRAPDTLCAILHCFVAENIEASGVADTIRDIESNGTEAHENNEDPKCQRFV